MIYENGHRHTAAWKHRFALRAKKMRKRWNQRWGRKFKLRLLDRARMNEARRLRQGHPDMTLGQSLVLQFLNEMRRG
jgi:hypothetical protein